MGDRRQFTGPVAMITGSYPAFSMTFVDREVRGLRDQGCEVLTYALRRSSPTAISGRFQVEEASRTVPLFSLVCHPGLALSAWLCALHHPARLMSTLMLAAKCLKHGPGLQRQIAYLCAAIVMAQHLRRKGIIHIHNHLGDSSGTVAMLAAELADVPFSMTLHGPEIFDQADRWHLRTKISRAAFVACISEHCLAKAAAIGRDEDQAKLRVVRCGVELDRYDAVTPQTAAENLLFVGRFERRKGLLTLIEAVSKLIGRGRRAHLTLVGDGTMRQSIERAISSAGLEDFVTLIGALDETDVAKAFARADIVIVPSLSEGLPVVIMEAMACGLPVIASAVDGIPELVVDGQTGLLVPPADPVALADAIERLSGNPALKARLGLAGRERVVRDHDASKNARHLLSLMTNQGAAAAPVRSTTKAMPAQCSHGNVLITELVKGNSS